MHDLTETATFSPAITVVDDGDDRNAASVQITFQQLANRTASLRSGTSENWTCAGDSQVDGNSQVGGDLNVGGANGVACNKVYSYGEIECVGTLTTTGNAHVVGSAVVNTNLTVDGNVTIGGNITLVGLMNGLRLPGAVIPDATATIAKNAITVVTNSGAAAFNLTINGTDQANGDWVIVRANTTNNCTLKDPAGATILILNGGGTQSVCCLAIRIAGNWVVALSG